MEKNRTLYKEAKSKGYPEDLCCLLHAKEMEDVLYGNGAHEIPCFVIDVLHIAIERRLDNKKLLKIALGNMSACSDFDILLPGYDSFEDMNIDLCIEDGEEAYSAHLLPSGEFNYKQAFEELVKKYPDFSERMKESGHPL